MRANIYVDGFNLYYGAVKDTKYKWLDIDRLFRLLRPHDSIETIYYFTAEIDGPRHRNQLTYLSALVTLPKVKIIFGKFKAKQVKCAVQECAFPRDRWFTVPEEKRTDVQIALRMVRDVWEDKCDRLIIATGDSDLVPAVNMVKDINPQKQVIVYVPARNPQRGAAVELRSAADKARILPNNLIRLAQFPNRLPDGSGGFLQKPQDW